MDVKFKPLYGVRAGGPLSYLLEIKNFTILLDCGWGDPYDLATLEPVLDILDSVDAVLLSHPDPAHLGALPFLVGKAKLDAAIYATGAIHKMGQMFLYNEYLTHHAAGDFDAFDLDEVDAVFGQVTQLRYRQEVALTGAGTGISITPLPSGRLIGGTVWKITAAGEEFVYAVDFNHRRERHLNGTPLEMAFHRPSLMIADAAAIGRPPTDRERAERTLLDASMATLRAEGNVLIPIDAAGRLLELLLLLDSYWGEHRLPYPLALVGPMVHTTLEFARSQLEWMNESLVKSFGHSKDNPFALRHVKLCSTLGELRKLPSGPKLVLAVEHSMAVGPARQLLVDWAADPRNTVIVALEPPPFSLAAAMLAAATERDTIPSSQPPLLHVRLSKRVPLKGEELERYLEEERRRREEEEEAAAAEAAANGMIIDGYGLGSEAGDLAGGSPRSTASGKSAALPTRANVASIGHAARDAAGLGIPGQEGDGIMLGEALDVGEEAAACLIEGFELAEGAVVPMFPEEDEWEAITYDEYGAVVDLREFEAVSEGAGGGIRLVQALASEAEAERGIEGGVPGAEEAPVAEEAPEAVMPTKIEIQELPVALAARVVRIDFDGRSDGRSVQNMLAHVAPRSVILVHASPEASAELAGKLSTELEGLYTSVFVPEEGQEIDVAVGSSFPIELSEKLMKAADMHAVSGYELAWVNGEIGPPEDGHVAMQEEGGGSGGASTSAAASILPTAGASGDQRLAVEPLMTLIPRSLPAIGAGAAPVAGPSSSIDGNNDGGASYGGVFIGDVRLSELRKALAAAGVRAEFHGGALYCAGQVVVRRRGEGGGLVLEGAMGDAYYKVRNVVYGQYHIC